MGSFRSGTDAERSGSSFNIKNHNNHKKIFYIFSNTDNLNKSLYILFFKSRHTNWTFVPPVTTVIGILNKVFSWSLIYLILVVLLRFDSAFRGWCCWRATSAACIYSGCVLHCWATLQSSSQEHKTSMWKYHLVMVETLLLRHPNYSSCTCSNGVLLCKKSGFLWNSIEMEQLKNDWKGSLSRLMRNVFPPQQRHKSKLLSCCKTFPQLQFETARIRFTDSWILLISSLPSLIW